MTKTHGAHDVVRVPLPGRAYDIVIGPGVLHDAAGLCGPHLRRPRVAVVTDEQVARLHLPRLARNFEAAGIEADAMELPAGEATKSWGVLQKTVEWLIERQIARDDVVVALGGGVIGDLAGFAAAVLRRGVRFIQVPTTLLAQVDSSVGGKTGINSPSGKNLIGAFHQPALVLADIELLATLPHREFLAGYAEVVKYGLLGDASFFDWLDQNGQRMLSGDAAARQRAVVRSCQMKANIVVNDETEKGDRALLNLGHTFGHALEAATGYSQRLLHGEAVSIGCVLAFETSAALGLCPEHDVHRVRDHLGRMGLRSTLCDIPGDLPSAERLIELMAQDKKVLDGRLAFVLCRGIGRAFLSRDVDLEVVRGVVARALSARNQRRNSATVS